VCVPLPAARVAGGRRGVIAVAHPGAHVVVAVVSRRRVVEAAVSIAAVVGV